MFSTILVFLFIIKLKLTRSKNLHNYLRSKYGGSTLQRYRKAESFSKKSTKAKLDKEFLLTCKMNKIVPNFLKFKLYRKSLYSSDFYRTAVDTLLDNEIKYKDKQFNSLCKSNCLHMTKLKNSISYLDFNHIKIVLEKAVNKCHNYVVATHTKKLRNLGISPFKFMTPSDVIFNLSDYVLTDKEKSLLALGLDFKLPCFKPNFVQYFLPFEKLAKYIKLSNLEPKAFDYFRLSLKNLAYQTWFSLSKNWFPFFNKDDFTILKKLAQNKNLVICKPDKGRGVVILNRDDYDKKMDDILSDTTKFQKVDEVPYMLANKMEDKINRYLNKLKERKIITDDTYSSLHSTGSSFGILYGLPKVHKGDHAPLRPILAAYNLPNFKLAKFLVPILAPLTKNDYTITDSFHFTDEILNKISVDNFLVMMLRACSLIYL